MWNQQISGTNILNHLIKETNDGLAKWRTSAGSAEIMNKFWIS